MYKRQRQNIDPGSLLTSLVVGVIVGGRLGFALFYQPQVLWTFDSSFPFWEILAIHKGGMASHGGMLGVLVASFLFVRKNKLDLYDTLHVWPTSQPFVRHLASFWAV